VGRFSLTTENNYTRNWNRFSMIFRSACRNGLARKFNRSPICKYVQIVPMRELVSRWASACLRQFASPNLGE